MKRSDKLLVLAGSLIAIALATFFIFFALNDSLLQHVVGLLFGGIGNRMVVVAASLLVVIVAVKIILDTTQRVNPYMAAMASGTNLGQVSVNLSALEKTALELACAVEGVDEARAFVEPRSKGVKVVIEIETPSGENLQAITRKIQQEVKTRFEKGIGVATLSVEILVKSLGVLDTAQTTGKD